MYRPELLFLLAALLSPLTHAQEPRDKIACFDYRKDNASYTKKLWDGYEISLGPSRNPDAVEDKCTAAIYNGAGKVVFRTSGFSVVFDEEVTGKDFDGDGQPEVVFRMDSGGGMHCCWAYIVFSLSPRPHKLFEIDMQGRVDFEEDKDGKIVIWKRTAGPYGFTSMARTPFGEKVLRVRGGKLVDATPEFCGKILSEESEDYQANQRWLTPDNLKKLESTGTGDWNNEEIVSALLSRALQHVFCRRFDEAMKDLDSWPEANRAKMKTGFADAIRENYPEFAAKLQEVLKSQ